MTPATKQQHERQFAVSLSLNKLVCFARVCVRVLSVKGGACCCMRAGLCIMQQRTTTWVLITSWSHFLCDCDCIARALFERNENTGLSGQELVRRARAREEKEI